jgi:hypothetical protein
MGTFLAAGMAQGATIYFVTNQEQTLTYALTAVVQKTLEAGSSVAQVDTVSVATKDVIGALGTNFSPKARLLLIQSAPTGTNQFVVRDIVDRTNVDTDVTRIFMMSNHMAVAKSKISNGGITGSEYGMWEIRFQTEKLGIDLFAYALSVIQTRALSATAIGAGTINGEAAVFKGSLILTPQTAGEVKSMIGGGPGINSTNIPAGP